MSRLLAARHKVQRHEGKWIQNDDKWIQYYFSCCALQKCKVTVNMPLATHHRCISCQLAMHGDCGTEVAFGDGIILNNTTFQAICHRCTNLKALQPLQQGVNKGKIASKRIKDCVNKIKAQHFQPLMLIKNWKEEDDMEITVDHDDETIDGDNKTSTVNDTSIISPPLQVITEGQKPIYMDLHLNIIPTRAEGMEAPVQTLAGTLKQWMKGIQEMEPTFKLHTVDPTAQNQTMIHRLNEFPTKLQDIQCFFSKAKPLIKGGKLYMRILASFQGSPGELTEKVKWYHQARQERFQLSLIQSAETTCVGWLQYSLPYTDKDLLRATLQELCGQQLELRWMRIYDGLPWKPGKDTREDPKAIHIWCDKNFQAQVQAFFKKRYGSTAIGPFPLFTKMRYIRPIQQLCNTEARAKYMSLRQQQDAWCKQAHVKQVSGITNIESISGIDKKTFRERILNLKMSMKRKDGSIAETQIFKAVNQNMRQGGGYLLTYHPDAEPLAQEKLAGLYLVMKEELGEDDLAKHFSPTEILKGKRLKWKNGKKGGAVVSEDDEEIEAIEALDEEMIILANIPGQGIDVSDKPTRITRDRMDDDTISTFDGTGSKRKRDQLDSTDKKFPARLDFESEEGSSNSTVSSVSSKTRRTTETRLSALTLGLKQLEDNHHKLKTDISDSIALAMKETKEAILSVLQTGPTSPGPTNSTVPPITPASYRTGGTGGNNG
jgi:hypothetical protein